MTTTEQTELPGMPGPARPADLERAACWYWGGEGSRTGVWLQRDDQWGYWTFDDIGEAAAAEVPLTRIRKAWFVATRCRDALDAFGSAHGAWVDRALGAHPPSDVDRWEAGTLAPTRKQIARLAWLTERPAEYFTPEGGAASIEYGRMCIRSGPGKGSYLIETGTRAATA